jgi:arylsulfatase A-like enzyme
VLAAVGCVVLGPLASTRVPTLGLHRNPLVALVTTALPRVRALDLAGDWRLGPFGAPRREDLSGLRGVAAGRNVVVVHLESTAAAHLRPYGARSDPMPTLTRLSRRGVLFENAYSAYPETIKSFVAAHCATWPALDVPAEGYARLGVPALAAVLGERGYATGLFHSGRFGYLGMEQVVRAQGYDTAEDAGAIGGERDSSFGIDEPSVVRRCLRWLDSLPPGRPFLLTYLPIAGHHPYLTPTPGPFPEQEEVGRYHNALRYADDALAQLLAGLRRRGRERNTLFVICGDHGEAFGEHAGNFGHTLFLYEENVRVPLLLLAPGLTEGMRVRRVASLVDLAPTVLDLLDVPAPRGWQGRSLLDGQTALALFCTDYSLGLLGLRDGRWKLIHELDSGRSQLFDLQTDPGERADMAERHPERVEAYTEHLRRWAAAQKYRVTRPGSLIQPATVARCPTTFPLPHAFPAERMSAVALSAE